MRHGRCAVAAGLRLAGAVICCLLIATPLAAQSVRATTPVSPNSGTPEQDDATLHDVTFVGSRIAYAVGERGVIRKTEDGGFTWRLLPAPVNCALRGVCFLTDRIGWVVGGGITPHVRTDWGVVLMTDDGGETWTILAEKTLPSLHDVQFFGLDRGIAVGETSHRFPNGLLITDDGGRTWRPMDGASIGGPRVAAFVDESTGFLGGTRGAAAIGGGQLLTGGPRFGLKGVHGVDLQPDGSGWLAGDGGLVMSTDSGGIRWTEPAAPLPRDLAGFHDFHAVSSRGTHVWLAGAPGSVIWHSPDAGRHWEPQFTGDAAPIHALEFTSESHGCAVGALGKLQVTTDGGVTWRTVHGGGRRVALLSFLAEARELSPQLVTRLADEDGYRLAAAVVARRDVGPDGHADEGVDLQLQDALLTAGGCDTDIDWRLPIAAPGLHGDYGQLVAQWRLITDGRLPEVMLGSLVARLRTWRPDVVVVQQPTENDAVARLIHDAVLQAVRQAGDPTRYPEQFELGGLTPWQVRRVFARLPAGADGTVALDPFQILPRRQRTLAMQSMEAAAKLPGNNSSGVREAYQLIWSGNQQSESAPVPAVRGFFTGLFLQAGGPARRDLPPITELDFDRLEQQAQHQRNFEAYTARMLDDPRHAAQIIAQLDDVLGPAPDEQAARQLWQLAGEYQQRSQWELAEATLLELVQRYPRQPVSLRGMHWLLTLWSSQEMTWQRVRGRTAGRSSVSTDAEVVRSGFEEFQRRLQDGATAGELRNQARSQSSPLLIEPTGGVDDNQFQAQERRLDATRWLEQAALLAEQMQRVSPGYFAEPEVQFLHAALGRRRAQYQTSDAVYREFALLGDGAWQLAGRGEVWALGSPAVSPKPVLRCRRAQEPPQLDGLLSDLIWQEADEVQLRDGGEGSARDGFIGERGLAERSPGGSAPSTAPRPLVMLAYDDEYLYFAASVPRRDGLPADPTQYAGRTHDADLSGFDQVSLQIDVDRDYATFYRFDVDSRAQTREACWIDERYDPLWYVASDADDRRWTVEAAIPLAELVAAAPMPADVWALGVARTMPTIGVEGWTVPASSIPRPPLFGFLRFE